MLSGVARIVSAVSWVVNPEQSPALLSRQANPSSAFCVWFSTARVIGANRNIRNSVVSMHAFFMIMYVIVSL